MADVEQRAEAEAAHKGLSGGAARAYVGGVFNRIRQAHSRGTQPGKGARHLQRKARVEARQEARNRVSRHEQLAALEKQRLRSRTHREEPRKSEPSRPKRERETAAPKKLVPIKQFDGNFQLDATRTMDPEFIREYFGEGQMRTAFELQTEHNLEQTIRLLEKRTGKEYRGPKTKAAMVNWILANG